MNQEQSEKLNDIHVTVKRLAAVVDGDPSRDIAGLRPRLTKAEKAISLLLEERTRVLNYVKGGLIGLGLNVAGMVVLIILIARFVLDFGG
jgi:hypothetical protein